MATYTHINGEFLSTIDQLNQAIEEGHGVTFNTVITDRMAP